MAEKVNMAKIDLKEMEKKSWQYTMQDGIMETLLGVLLLIYGITLVTSLPVVFAIVFWIIFIIPAYMAMKKKFTDPRIGQVKLQEDKPVQTASGIFLYMIAVAAIMGVGVFALFGEITDEYRKEDIVFPRAFTVKLKPNDKDLAKWKMSLTKQDTPWVEYLKNGRAIIYKDMIAEDHRDRRQRYK